MGLIWKHLSSGLFYPRSFRLIPGLVGTIIPFFWQLINLYGTLPAAVITVGIFQLSIVTIAALIYPLLCFKWGFIEIYCLAAAFMLLALISWQLSNIWVNRRVRFKMFKLQYSTRTAMILLGLLLGNSWPSLPMSPRTSFWDLHLKPKLAGQLRYWDREKLVQTISHDFRQAVKVLEDAIFFGCSPGSFKKLLHTAGIEESQYIIIETIIPHQHARVFGLKRTFYFYVIKVHNNQVPRMKSEA